MAASPVWAQSEFEGLFIGNEFEITWNRSGGCTIVTRPRGSSGSFQGESMDFDSIPSAFSCEPHRFEGGFATVTHERARLSTTIPGETEAPSRVIVEPILGVSAGISGNARFTRGGDSHRVRVSASSGGAGAGCGSSESHISSQDDGRAIAASIECAITELEVLPQTVETETAEDGREIVTAFVAKFETTVAVLMDHGNSGNLGIANGARYQILVRSRYRFKLVGAGDRSQEPPPPNPYQPLPASDSNFVVTEGFDLDTGCTFRENGQLQIEIDIDRVVGQVQGDGELAEPQKLIGNGFVTPTATLRLAVWDVDASPPPSTNIPAEVDHIQLNGRDIGDMTSSSATLQGSDKSWRVNQFEVPIELLRFGRYNPGGINGSQSPPAPGRNTITIEIDLDSPASEDGNWCTSVDWASLSFGAMAPLALVHGTNAQQSTWELAIGGPSPVEHLTSLGIPFEHRINLLANGSPDENANRLTSRLINIAKGFGVDALHLVTHSKGATDSRRMLHAYYREDQPIRILSLFSIGTPSKGTVLSSAGVIAANAFLLTKARRVFSDPDIRAALQDGYAGNWAGMFGLAPVDPARAAQTPEAMRGFNLRNPKHPAVPYFSIAGAADANGNDVIELSEADGMFPDVAPGFVHSIVGTRIHRFLGRVSSLRMREQPTGLIGSLINLSTLESLTTYNTVTETAVRTEPAPNDLVSTAASTHCTECGFVPLQTYPHNHSALKNVRTMDLILRQIRGLFPVSLGGGR